MTGSGDYSGRTGGGGGGASGLGRTWVSQFRAAASGGGGGVGAASSVPSPHPASGEFSILSGVTAGMPAMAGAGEITVKETGESTGGKETAGAAGSTMTEGVLKEGDAVEAQFFLSDQAVWTTSWYRGEVSLVNRSRSGGGSGIGGTTAKKNTTESGQPEEGGEVITYCVDFADGDRLDEVPASHIRLFRGLRVGSVVSVEWPEKGSRPFKGCLTKVSHGEGDSPPTVSVIYEDTDTEVRSC